MSLQNVIQRNVNHLCYSLANVQLVKWAFTDNTGSVVLWAHVDVGVDPSVVVVSHVSPGGIKGKSYPDWMGRNSAWATSFLYFEKCALFTRQSSFYRYILSNCLAFWGLIKLGNCFWTKYNFPLFDLQLDSTQRSSIFEYIALSSNILRTVKDPYWIGVDCRALIDCFDRPGWLSGSYKMAYIL